MELKVGQRILFRSDRLGNVKIPFCYDSKNIYKIVIKEFRAYDPEKIYVNIFTLTGKKPCKTEMLYVVQTELKALITTTSAIIKEEGEV
jgi:hypothetical protein